LDNIALALPELAPHELGVGALTVTVTQCGQTTRLAEVACSLGRRDRPYPETHDGDWTIALVTRGTFSYRGGATNRRHVLRPGWLLLGAPRATFECSHEHDGGDDCVSLSLAETVIEEVSRAAGRDCGKLLASVPALPSLPRVAALVDRARRGHGDLDELGCLVFESVVAYAGGAPPTAATPPPSHVARVHDIMESVELACREPLTLTELARDAGFSSFHFLRVFRQVTGTTPHQYLIGARLRLAARLLLDTDRPVTEIAYDVGFNDLSNFIRTFRRVIGETPREYRRR
jgi:AraC family transcriptional regulator